MNWIPPPERHLSRDLWISLENCGSHRARQQLIMEKRWLRHNRESLRATPSDSHSEGDLRVNDRLTYVCKIFLKPSEKLWLSLVSNKASIQTHSFIHSVSRSTVIRWILYSKHCVNFWVSVFIDLSYQLIFFHRNLLSLFD